MKDLSQLTQKSYISFVLAAVMLLFLTSCELEENPIIDEQVVFEPDLIHCELAFPGITGDRYVINYDGESITCEFINGLYIYQGDIQIEPNDVKSIKGSGIESDNKRWSKNIVPYKINENLPDQNRVIDAINQYEEKTNISFVEQTNEDNFIEFIADEYGCSSNLGMIGGKQYIRIANWAETGNVIHEIGHALGLIHEHSIQNRDESINIVWENIPIEKQHNFITLKKSLPVNGLDFNSIMLWSSDAIAIEHEKPTMTKLDGASFTVQRDSLSEKDVEIINQMYPPLVYLHIETNPISNIINSTAICGGTIVEHYNVTIVSKGVCWSSTTSNPNINHQSTNDGSGTESYSSTLTGLTPGTTYYVRAYASTGYVIYYGEVYSFLAN